MFLPADRRRGMKRSKSENLHFVASLIVFAVVALDQASKLAAKAYISEDVVRVLPFFNIVLVMNKGAAWGIFSGKSTFLLAISFAVLAAIILFHEKITEGWRERAYALSLIAGGIIGNTIDRIWWKAVVDFLDFHAFGSHWPAFNVADSAICVGVGIFVISNFLRPESGKKNVAFR